MLFRSTCFPVTIHPGISIMDMDTELDHGDIYIQEEFKIEQHTNKKDLEDNIINRAPILLEQVLKSIEKGTVSKEPQNHSLATNTKKIRKEDGELLETDSDKVVIMWDGERSGYLRLDYYPEYKGNRPKFFDENYEIQKLKVKAYAEDLFLRQYGLS